MNTKEMIEQMKQMKNNGTSSKEIYNKYKKEDLGEKRIAVLVASLPDNNLSNEYRILKIINMIVVALMCIPFTKAVMFFNYSNQVDISMNYLCIASIGIAFPILNAVSFYMNRSQAFSNFIILTSFFLIMSILVIKKEYYEVNLTYILGFAYSVIAIVLTAYTKIKLFPYLTLWGTVNKESDGNPIFD